jgi:hypothetical protein
MNHWISGWSAVRRWISIVGGKPGPNRLIVLSACITDNDAVNVMAAMIASKFGIRLKIVRVRFLQFGFPNSLLSDEDLTIDLMLHPEEMVAQEIVRTINLQSNSPVN